METLYLRHFIVGIAFLLILFSFVLASLYERGILGKTICLILLAAFFVANSFPLVALYKYGRGHYRDAVRFIAEHSSKDVVTIGGDHDFRITMVLQFYVHDAMGNKRAQYLDHDSLPPDGPDWVIFHKESFENPAPPAPCNKRESPVRAAGQELQRDRVGRARGRRSETQPAAVSSRGGHRAPAGKSYTQACNHYAYKKRSAREARERFSGRRCRKQREQRGGDHGKVRTVRQ
jgi:hypothetical protein